MMESIEIVSKVRKNKFWGIIFLSFLLLFIFLGFIIRPIIFLFRDGFTISGLIITGVFILLEIIIVVGVKDFKILKINKMTNTLKYYNIMMPFGKTLNLKYFTSKVKSTEISNRGKTEVIYLVNQKGYTSFKISSLYYENYSDIYNAIDLPLIKDYDLNFGKYFKLLFTGRIKIFKEMEEGKSKKTENTITYILNIFITIAFFVFALGMIIKIMSKLFA